MKNLYMAVTADALELPIAVAGSAAELGRILGIRAELIQYAIARERSGKQSGVKFVRVPCDESEADR